MSAEVTVGKLRGGLCAYWHDVTGKRVRHHLKALTRADAEAEAIDVYKRFNPQTLDLTIAGIWDSYVKEREGRPVATTMKSTGKAILAHFGSLRPDQISTNLCRSYAAMRRKKTIKDGSILTELNHLRTALSWAVKQRLITYVPHIEIPQKPAPKDRYLTRNEIDRLLSADMHPHIKLLILLLLSTGSRVGAALELTWDRVNFERNVIDLRKSATGPRKGRATVPMNAGMRAALQDARKAALTDHVIEYASRNVVNIRRGFLAAVNSAGLKQVSPHVLRHTAAVHMAEAGIPMSEISQFLGHSSTNVTERIYARYSPSYLTRAADTLDFTRVRIAP